MNMTNRRADLLGGPIRPTILKMAAGMIVGMLAMSAFNATDTYFVGRLGPTDLAAMSYTFPVVMIIGSVALGLGVGLSSTVSRAIGGGNHHKVKRLTTDGLILAVLIVAVLSALGLITIDPLFRSLGASGETLEKIRRYMRIWYIGMPFVVIPMAGNNVIRATGDTLTPTLIMVISVVINVALDPLLIFGIGFWPEMGIAGAALATVFARMSSFLVSLYILSFRERVITLERAGAHEMIENWKEIAFVGIPAALVQAINPISLSVITRILSSYGDEAVAAFGAASRVEMLVLMIPMTLAAVLAPFIGQNWGAKHFDRILKGLNFTALISLGWGLIVFFAFLPSSSAVISIFSRNPAVISTGALYLRIISISYGFLGLMFLSSQAFNAVNKPIQAAFVTLTKAFVLNVPLALAGSYLFGLPGVFVSTFIANTAAGILGMVLFHRMLRNHEAEQETGESGSFEQPVRGQARERIVSQGKIPDNH